VISNALISFLIEQVGRRPLKGHRRESVLFGEDLAINNDYVRTPKSRPVYLYHSFGYRDRHIVCFEGCGVCGVHQRNSHARVAPYTIVLDFSACRLF
jgi:hypothetical protein